MDFNALKNIATKTIPAIAITATDKEDRWEIIQLYML